MTLPSVDSLCLHFSFSRQSLIPINNRPQQSFGKVMFPQASVILFTGGGGLCPSMHHRSHDWGVSVQGGLCPGGSVQGGSLSGGSLSGRVSVQWGSLSRGVSVRETPHMVMGRKYASYWYAFLFVKTFEKFNDVLQPVYVT